MKATIIVGVGQHCERTSEPQQLHSALDLAARAAEAALRDCHASGDVAAAIDTLAWVRTFSDSVPQFKSQFGFSNNPPQSLANRISARPARLIHSAVGGNVPQALVNEMAAKIGSGEVEMALLAGGEAIANEVFALKNGLQPDWSEQVETQCDERDLGIAELATPHEVAHGLLGFAPVTYSLFENVIRNRLGHSHAQHLAYLSELMGPFVDVARANPKAMFEALPERAQLQQNDAPVTSIYSKHYCAREKVNQAAALLVTSPEKATQLGIPESRWVYLHGGAEASEKTLLRRQDLSASRALEVTTRRLFEQLGISVADLAYFDLYSCFPSAVEAAMSALGIASDDPRPMTLTGGLPYFGGPGNNYSMHGIAELVARLRADRQAKGLVTANGGILSKQAIGVYSAQAPSAGCQLADKQSLQAEVDDSPEPEVLEAAQGPARIETYTLSFARGKPAGAVVIGRMEASGARCVALVDGGDSATLESLSQEGVIGQVGLVEPGAKTNRFRLAH